MIDALSWIALTITLWLGACAVLRIWAERPAVGLDPNTSRYRSVRRMHKERQR